MRNVKQTIILAPLAAAALVASAPLSSRSANFNFEGCDSVPPSAREATFSIDGGDSAPLSARDATFSINREVAPAVPRSPSFPSPGLLPSETQQPRLAARDEPAAAAAAASAPGTTEQNVAGGGYKPDKGDGYGYGGYKEDKKEKKKEALKKAVEGVAQTAVEVGLKAYQGLKAAQGQQEGEGRRLRVWVWWWQGGWRQWVWREDGRGRGRHGSARRSCTLKGGRVSGPGGNSLISPAYLIDFSSLSDTL